MGIRKCFILILCAAVTFSFSLISHAQNSENGSLSGSIVDADTQEELIGAVVKIDGTGLGAVCDINGEFIISGVPAGTHTVIAFMVGYQEKRIENVIIKAGTNTGLDITISPDAIEVDEVKVKARVIRNTDEALIQERKEEDAVTDAVSAEAISSTGSGDAAAAMKQVTGATVVGGKEVYVRGLGDRYMNVQLNGSNLPSTSQYKRTVQMDIFPAGLLDNIATQKTFTPDKPGNFTGGSVDIKTKSFPDKFTLNVSASSSMNSQASLQDGFLTYDGGDKDWLGSDDGSRDIPGMLNPDDIVIPDNASASQDMDKAQLLDSYTKAFNTIMYPHDTTSPVNQSYSLTIGNRVNVLERPLGFVGSLSYSNSYSYYDDGEYNRWKLTGHIDEKTELDDELAMKDQKSSNDVVLGALFNSTYKIHEDHEVGINYMFNQTGENKVRLLTGSFPEADIDVEDGRYYNASVLHYNERTLHSFQFHGDHEFQNLRGTKFEWRATVADASQNEPDMRYFNYHYRDRIYNGEEVRVYSLDVNQYKAPNRYFRTLDESINEFSADLSIPIKETGDVVKKESLVKVGGAYSSNDRTFRERRFQYKLKKTNYIGDENTIFADSVFADNNLGMTSDTSPYRFGTHILDASEDRASYDGDQEVTAFYSMIDYYLIPEFRIITGARFEKTSMNTVSADTTYQKGSIETDDILPSVNLVYKLNEQHSLRGAYGRTLARPSFREMAPFPSEDFAGGYIFTGNPDLDRTLIDNFDLRFERYGEPGEIMAVSLFAKSFHDPIERVILNVNNEISFQNVDRADVKGVEFEVRKNLGTFASQLSAFRAGFNLSLVSSEVDIPEREMQVKRVSNPNASSTREFQGQSPYVLNIDLNYDNVNRGIKSTIYFNTFGKRLSEASIGATPYVYEQPVHTLNYSFTQDITSRLSWKLSANNLLDSEHKRTQTFKGKEYIVTSYTTGRSFSMGLTYKL